jgi:hypothetical protein
MINSKKDHELFSQNFRLNHESLSDPKNNHYSELNIKRSQTFTHNYQTIYPTKKHQSNLLLACPF